MRKPDVDNAALRRLLARIFTHSADLQWERTPDGVSTQVYRIFHGRETFYLRVAEDEAASLAPEAALHTELLARGVSVPEVTHFERFDEGLRRSVLVTSEIAGAPMVRHGDGGSVLDIDVPDPDALPGIYRAAGRDLARLNKVPVDGFGWVIRDGVASLRGECASYAEWAAPYDPAELRLFGFSARHIDQAAELLSRQVAAGPAGRAALLAHGDFDLTHVFHRHGRYTGIIDFGEIRGSEGWFDLAMFGLMRLPEAEGPSLAAVRYLEEGYAEISPLPADYRLRLLRTAVLIVANRLIRGYLRRGPGEMQKPWFTRDCGQLGKLLTETAKH